MYHIVLYDPYYCPQSEGVITGHTLPDPVDWPRLWFPFEAEVFRYLLLLTKRNQLKAVKSIQQFKRDYPSDLLPLVNLLNGDPAPLLSSLQPEDKTDFFLRPIPTEREADSA